MDIKVGELRINVSALALYKHGDNPALSNWIAMKSKPVQIYNWNCQTQLGDRPRLPVFQQETAFNILVTNNGAVDMPLSVQLSKDLTKAADLDSLRDFNAKLQEALPPLQTRIEWDRLWAPYKDDYSFIITAQVLYLHCVGRPYGMDITDYFYILVPFYVTFSTIITGSCGGTDPNGSRPMWMSTRRRTNRLMEQFERQIVEEEEEAEAARQRELDDAMMEWGLDHTHGGTLLDDEEEPEPNEEEGGD